MNPNVGDLVDSDKIMGDKPGGDNNIADQPPGGIVSDDRGVQVTQLDLPRLFAAMRQSLPEDDPSPAYLMRSLRAFRNYHARLYDCKELHNHLNDILINYWAFSREVERLAFIHEDPEPHTLSMHWRPNSQRVGRLLDWASAPRAIIEGEPFARLEDRIIGPMWAVELCVAADRLDDLMRPAGPPRLFAQPRSSWLTRPPVIEIGDLYDATSEFLDTAERWMYLVDRQLRETVSELLSLSRSALASLERE